MVFGSIRENVNTAIFLRALAEIKKFALRAASTSYIFSPCSNSIWKSFSLKQNTKYFKTEF